MTFEQAKSELMQIYGALSPDKQRAIDTLLHTIERSNVMEQDKDHIWYKGGQYISLRRFLNVKAEAEQEPKWIPVSERLPEDGTWNLFTDGKNVSVERYKSDAIDHFFPEGRWFSFENVIAWMPLPKPYKAESEDNE